MKTIEISGEQYSAFVFDFPMPNPFPIQCPDNGFTRMTIALTLHPDHGLILGKAFHRGVETRYEHGRISCIGKKSCFSRSIGTNVATGKVRKAIEANKSVSGVQRLGFAPDLSDPAYVRTLLDGLSKDQVEARSIGMLTEDDMRAICKFLDRAQRKLSE